MNKYKEPRITRRMLIDALIAAEESMERSGERRLANILEHGFCGYKKMLKADLLAECNSLDIHQEEICRLSKVR